jgi:hypothetical protein
MIAFSDFNEKYRERTKKFAVQVVKFYSLNCKILMNFVFLENNCFVQEHQLLQISNRISEEDHKLKSIPNCA